jgi:hypothetical protein
MAPKKQWVQGFPVIASEAKQSIEQRRKHGLLRFARNDN